jgi:GNAT superfamily N-acetyltransferase
MAFLATAQPPAVEQAEGPYAQRAPDSTSRKDTVVTQQRRRLSAARRERIRVAILGVTMHRRLDPYAIGDRIAGEQSWSCSLSEDELKPLAGVVVHRVPLHTGHNVPWNAEIGDFVPGEPVDAAVEVDELTTLAYRSLGRPRAPREDTASLLVADSLELDEVWRGLGVAELVLTTALLEVATGTDLTVVAEPAVYYHRADGERRQAPREEVLEIYSRLGFVPLKARTWILADWGELEAAHAGCQRRFGFTQGSKRLGLYEPSFIISRRAESKTRVETAADLCALHGGSADLDQLADFLSSSGRYDRLIWLSESPAFENVESSRSVLEIGVDAGQGALGVELEFPFTVKQFHRTLREAEKEAAGMEEYASEQGKNEAD